MASSCPSRRALLRSFGVAAVPLAGCTGRPASNYEPGDDPATRWYQPAYDTGATAYAPDAAAPREGVTERWQADVASPPSRPVVDSGHVYVAVDGDLLALDLDSGEERWRASRHRFHAPPALDYETVYATTRDGPGLVALDRVDGSERWRVETRGDVAVSPAFDVVGDSGGKPHRLYVGDRTGRVYAVDQEGSVVATADVFGPVTAVTSGPGVATGLLVGAGGEVLAFRVSDDGLHGRWRRRLGGEVTHIAVDGDGDAFAAARHVYRLGHRGGTRWRADTGGRSLAVTPHHVFTGQAGFAALDPATGRTRWSFDPPVDTAPAVAGDTVYASEPKSGFTAFKVGGGAGLTGLRFGRRRWHHPTEGLPVGGLAIAGGAVVGGTMLPDDASAPGGRVYVLDPA